MKVSLIPKRKIAPSNALYGETGLYYTDVVERKLIQVAQTTDLSAHEAAADPHTGYRLESADHTHQSTGLQAGTLDHGLALTGLTDNDHTQYILHSLATTVNDFLVASGSGAYVKKTLAETLTILGKAVASGLASLDGSSLVVQNPANATATPTASKIPIADGSGLLDGWVSLALKAPIASPTFTGTVTLPTTVINNNVLVGWKDSGGTTRNLIGLGSDNNLYIRNDANNLILFYTNGAGGVGNLLERIRIGTGNIAVMTLANLTVTGLTLSGALDANGQALNNTPSILLTPSGAPATTEGNFYYDSTAHKLKVRVAAGWETVTSA